MRVMLRSIKMVEVVRTVNVLSQGGPFVVASADLDMTGVVYDGGGDRYTDRKEGGEGRAL